MKKCHRCKVVFHLDERIRCLYCDSLLQQSSSDETKEETSFYIGRFYVAQNLIKKLLSDKSVEDHGRVQFLVSSFFKTRTFLFSYKLSRKDYKIGKEYKRFLVHPLTLSSILMTPWVVWAVFDTLIIRMMYNGFCETCGWKFIRYTSQQEHDPDDCEFNREFIQVIDDVVSGKITVTEQKHKWLAQQKEKEGKRSAYSELCAEKKTMSGVWDILCIWFSILLLLFVAVKAFMPLATGWLGAVEYEMEY